MLQTTATALQNNISKCFIRTVCFFLVCIRFFFHNFIYETKIEKKRYSKLFVQNQYGQKVTFFNTR